MTYFHIAAGAIFALVPFAAQAEFPERPINIVLPFGAGGADAITRAFALEMAEVVGQNVVVSSQPGAGGTIGTAAGATAEPDGYTLTFQAVGPMATQPHLRELPYDQDSWSYVCRWYDEPVVLMTGGDSEIDSVEELVAMAQADPNSLVYGAGPGSVPHLAMLDFASQLGLELRLLPSSGGSADAMQGMANGTVDLHAGPGVLLSRFEVRPLALFGTERAASLPDLPTMSELGSDVVFTLWGGLSAPAGTPDDVIEVLANACETIVTSASFIETLANLNFGASYAGPDEYRAFAQAELEKYGVIIANSSLAR